jgi:16S rRNA processing protein RimM
VATGDGNWVELAQIVRPQGRTGEVLAEIRTDFPESFAERKSLFLRAPSPSSASPNESTMQPAVLEAHWFHKGRIVLKFQGVNSITDAEKLRNYEVVLPIEERMALTGDAVYLSDLIGITIIDVGKESPHTAGIIVDVEPEGISAAMLVVETGAKEPALIPFAKAYIRRLDIDAKQLEMDLPEGLLTLQEPARTRAPKAKQPGDETRRQ